MSSLPHEVLTLIFDSLGREDLLQCQLTSKQWYKASLTHLYSDLSINSDEKSLAYVRTITNSPQLGKYLQSIDFVESLKIYDDEIIFDKDGLLNAVIQYCPNIAVIECFEEDLSFWTRIMYAATQGQLSHLNLLPEPNSRNLESYIYTALMFKHSLSVIYLKDDRSCFGPHLARLRAYQTLCDQIGQFENLAGLNIDYLSESYLSSFDGLIDKCPHLESLSFDVKIYKVLQPNGQTSPIHPRVGIKRLLCNWSLISDDRQLEYIMCKFPNLQLLRVSHEKRINQDNMPNCSGTALIKFIRYVMSIPNFGITIEIDEKDLLNIWAEFTKTKNGCKNVSIGYICYRQFPNILCNMELNARTGMNLLFPFGENADVALHMGFLSEAGRGIRSLKVKRPDIVPYIDGPCNTIDGLFDILQSCPLLKEFTIFCPPRLSSIEHPSKYPSIEKLTINGMEYAKSIHFLNFLSLNLPKLQQVYLNFHSLNGETMNPLTINMPLISLDLLAWTEKECTIEYVKHGKVYIKLNTDAGLKFYEGKGNLLTQVDPSRYFSSSRHMRLNINCKHLKEFRIRRNRFYNFDF